jgi:DNA-binding beta-propeller fold protein YncE
MAPRQDGFPTRSDPQKLTKSIMKISSSSGTSRLRSLSLAVALWLGLSGVFPVGAAIEQTDATGSIAIRKFFVGGVPEGVLFDGTYIWVTDAIGDSVSKVRRDGTVFGTFPTMGSSPRYLAFDGENIWVTHYGQFGRVSKLRASDGAFLGSFYGGEYPTGIVYAAGKIWVAAASCCSVILRPSDGQQVGGFGE